MPDYDEILQQKLSDLENGKPLNVVLEELANEEDAGAAELKSLVQLAAAVRSIPHPVPQAASTLVQRQRVMTAAEAVTRPVLRPAAPPARRSIWDWFGARVVVVAVGAIALFLTVLFTGMGFWLAGQDPDIARVENVSGQVQVAVNAEGTKWQNLKPGDLLRQGQRVRTLGASSATLAFHEGSRTVLSAYADVTLQALNGASGQLIQVELVQNSGETQHQVTPLRGTKSYFLVHTPSGTASVHGTSFNVHVSESGKAYFAVNTGEVQVQNETDAVTLLAGQATTADPAGSIEEPAYLFSVQGSLVARDDAAGIWNVSGFEFQVHAATAITGDPQLSDLIRASGVILPDGTRRADLIEPAADNQQPMFFTGVLNKADGDTWIVGSTSIQIDDMTELGSGLVTGIPVAVTFNILDDGTLLALKIEALVEEPETPEPLPTATPDPDAMPSYAFEPDELETTACASAVYDLSGALRNTADEAKDYAAYVQLGYLIDRGGEYVSAVELAPAGWERIEAGQTVLFNIHVTTNESWADAPEGSEIKLRVYIASAANRPDHLNGRLTVTITAGCAPEPEPSVTPTATQAPESSITPSATTPSATPTVTPTAVPTAAVEGNTCTGANPHPTGMKLAQRYGVPYEEIMRWFCQHHYGFGEIDMAYSLSRQSGRPVEEIFAMRASGMGWGEIKKQVQGDDKKPNRPDNQNKQKGKDKKGKKNP